MTIDKFISRVQHLAKFSAVSGTQLEPSVGPHRTADIRVTLRSGTQHVLDLGTTCPATEGQVRAQPATHVTPGAAAERYAVRKRAHYRGRASVNVIPFIIETGGRLGSDACRFIDETLSVSPEDRTVASNLYKHLLRKLWLQNAFQLSRIAQELPAPDAAARPDVDGA